jgi:hypothetical protein
VEEARRRRRRKGVMRRRTRGEDATGDIIIIRLII